MKGGRFGTWEEGYPLRIMKVKADYLCIYVAVSDSRSSSMTLVVDLLLETRECAHCMVLFESATHSSLRIYFGGA